MGMRLWSGFAWRRIVLLTGSCLHGNEHSDVITGGDFLDKLRDYQLLKKESAPWR
jgi:hypothetical protein